MDTKNKEKQSSNNQNTSCKEGKTLAIIHVKLQTFKEYLTLIELNWILMSFQNYSSGNSFYCNEENFIASLTFSLLPWALKVR